MCTGNIHEDWYCCRPYLLTVHAYQNALFELAQPIKHFLSEGANRRVMCQFDGYPPDHITPPLVIEVQRDHRAKDGLPKTTRYYYFALDRESSVWYDIGTERWMQIRGRMAVDSGVKIPCADHRISHYFTMYRTYEEILRLYLGRDKALKFGASPLSHRDARKEKARA
ncbi:uncharacterized protein RAG0_08891 [Rhynchosporium agropyri]|uniref:Uncharacterized protein n=1 Tax=Rhynchosporium agropyri TaxID=914238 RepID=A0A1E1KSX0_9HELO|nr:uncharacterized protein RAG0_08891 [Rhynchosporium agropyri]